MKPLLAQTYEPHRVTYPCYVQPKLNGVRALYQAGRFQSRDELPFPVGLLDHLAKPLLEVFPSETILDGELYVHGWPLQRINAAVTPVRQQPTEDTLKVEYHVFDVVDFGKSFEERTSILQEKLYPDCGAVPVYTTKSQNNEISDLFYADFVKQGYEGMMYRLGNCPYTSPKQVVWCDQLPEGRLNSWSDKNNRCWHLLKRKDWQDDEYECIGVVEGEGKLKGMLGALTCAATPGPQNIHGKTYSSLSFSVGSGLTDSERQHYWQNPPIGRQVKVKYLVLSNDGIPLNPTILAIL